MRSAPQAFAENLLASLLSLLKVPLMSKFGLPHPGELRKSDECIILGNGPSLNQSLIELKNQFGDRDLFAVNFFCNTPEFSALKPGFLVAAAPEFYMTDLNESSKAMANRFHDALLENTSWPLTLFMPAAGRKFSAWQQKLVKNHSIDTVFYNTTPAEGFEGLVRIMTLGGLGMPRPHNVLIPSIVIALRMGYKKIFLLGADHSWLKDLWVDDHNRVMLRQKHFYDEQTAQAAPMYKLGKSERSLQEVLDKFRLSFLAYELLEPMARREGRVILNLTPNSYIDAFERAKGFS